MPVLLTAAGLHSSPQTPSACSTCGIATDRQSSCLLVSPADRRTTAPGDECQAFVYTQPLGPSVGVAQ